MCQKTSDILSQLLTSRLGSGEKAGVLFSQIIRSIGFFFSLEKEDAEEAWRRHQLIKNAIISGAHLTRYTE